MRHIRLTMTAEIPLAASTALLKITPLGRGFTLRE